MQASTLDATVVPVGYTTGGGSIAVPAYQVGWLQRGGNAVLVGHNPGVFTPLLRLKVGDVVVLNGTVQFTVTEVHLLPDVGQPDAVRRENGRFLDDFGDTRVTLVTCVGTSRLIVIAK